MKNDSQSGRVFTFLSLLSQTEDSSRTWTKIMQQFESDLPYACAVMRHNADQNELSLVSAPSLPDSLCQQLLHIACDPSERSCGAAVSRREPVIAADIRTSPLWATCKDDVIRHGFLSCSSIPIQADDGRIIGTFDLYGNETGAPADQQLAHAAYCARLLGFAMEYLRQREQWEHDIEWSRLVMDHVSDFIAVVNSKEDILYLSPSCRFLFGLSAENIRFGGNQSSNRYFRQLSPFIQQLIRLKKEQTEEFEWIDESGQTRWFEVKGFWIRNRVLLVSREVTERKRYEHSLNRALYYDVRTGLPNRIHLKLQLNKLISAKTPFTLYYLNFNQLNEIREAFGAKAVHWILQHFSKRMEKAATFHAMARMAEGSFALISTDADTVRKAEQQALDILEHLNDPWSFEEHQIFTTVSLGIVLHENQTTDMIIAHAENALRYARQEGEHTFYIWNDNKNRKEELTSVIVQNKLYNALERDELRIVYQPQIDLRTGRVVGVEALLRWDSPELGLVAPGEFIRIAEKNGWIIPIGEWVMRQVCADLNKLHRTFPGLHAAINISYRQLQDKHFVERMHSIMQQFDMKGSHIHFEITETMLMDDAPLALRILSDLKQIGARISIDDFGIGYSSLSYLKQFPIDILKIDRSFVANIQSDPQDLAIVQAIMNMSRALELDVIAEGAENRQHELKLKHLGCRYFQGYYYSMPISFDRLPHAIRHIEDKLAVES